MIHAQRRTERADVVLTRTLIPPEWSLHAATWLQWPKGEEKRHERTFSEIVKALAPSEYVRLIVSDESVESSARAVLAEADVPTDNVRVHRVPTDWCWCRDNGPLFAFDSQGIFVIDWLFTGWLETKSYRNDDLVPVRVAQMLGKRVVSYQMVVEGGALEFNGAGIVIASRPCLRDRNRSMTDAEIEAALKEALGAERIVWLERFEKDDFTKGHPDSIARFADDTTVIVGEVVNRDDSESLVYEDAAARVARAGLKVRRMPLPGRITYNGRQMLANYLNWYIANGSILVGTFDRADWDSAALAFVADLSREFWGGRKVAGIEIKELWADGGGIHCVTQQEPC